MLQAGQPLLVCFGHRYVTVLGGGKSYLHPFRIIGDCTSSSQKKKRASALWECVHNDSVLLKSSLLLSVVQLSSCFVLGRGRAVLQLSPCARLVLQNSLQNLNFSDYSKSFVIPAWAIRAPRWMEGLQCLLFKLPNREVVILFGLD